MILRKNKGRDGMKKGTMKKYLFLLTFCLAASLSGCKKEKEEGEKEVQVTIAEYQKNTYATATVKYGSIEPVLSLELTPDEFESNSYSIWQEMLEVEEINVEKGTKVQAGDVMVVFKSEGIAETIEEYEKRKTEDQMLIEHYTKLMKIDKKEDYSKDIKKLKNDLAVANLYIKEQNDRLSEYQLVAEKAGTVTFVSEDLLKGYGVAGKAMVTVASGSSNYTAATTDDFVFQVGDTYKARFGVADYEMKVIAVEEKDGGHVITFEPVSDMAGVSESDVLVMDIQKEKIENAVYVEENAIFMVENKTYVYRLDKDGFREAVPVTIGATVDGYVIIEDGLKEGEQVTLN